MSKRKLTSNDDDLEELVFGKDVLSGMKASNAKSGSTQPSKSSPSSAWFDEDDAKLEVDLSATNRLKKLKKEGKSNSVSGEELHGLLSERFQGKKPQWARSDPNGNGSDIVNRSGKLLEKGHRGALKSGKIDIQRVSDANIASSSSDSISVVKFSKSNNLLLSGGEDKHLRLFKIDGDRNDLQLDIKFQDCSIFAAGFSSDNKIFVAGRRPHFYSYDIESGVTQTITGLRRCNLKSHEHMTLSPDGSKLAFSGAGGSLHIVNAKHQTWMYDVKMNTAVKSACFLNENVLLSAGYDADVYLWDVRKTGTCLQRFHNEDGMSCHSLGVMANSDMTSYDIAVGSESGVVSLYRGDMNSLTSSPSSRRSIMNLTTNITSTVFHPSGEILAIASVEKKDEMRLVHVESETVFSNWPTETTPLQRVTSVDFSPMGGYMAVANRRGKVLLYRLRHYGAY